nr:hypothetical protein [Morchella crassipes]
MLGNERSRERGLDFFLIKRKGRRPAQQPPRLVGPLPSFLFPPLASPPLPTIFDRRWLEGGGAKGGVLLLLLLLAPRPSFSFEESKRRTGGAWTGSQHPSPPLYDLSTVNCPTGNQWPSLSTVRL